jgi:hypothetical protein
MPVAAGRRVGIAGVRTLAVVEVAYLKKGEAPPPGTRAVIVECAQDGAMETITVNGHETVIRVAFRDLQTLVDELAERGVKKVYVRGIEDAQTPPRARETHFPMKPTGG